MGGPEQSSPPDRTGPKPLKPTPCRLTISDQVGGRMAS